MGILRSAPSLVSAIQTCACGARIDVAEFVLFQEVMCPACCRRLLVAGHFDRFHLERRIGTGTGTVYKAYDPQLGGHVALRLVDLDPSSDEGALARVENEVLAVASLNHPNILGVHEVGRAQDRFYVAMELAEAGTLADRFEKQAVVPEDQALEIARQIASALSAAWRAGLIHRSLKPGNVFIRNSTVRVADFGLARIEESIKGAQGDLWGGHLYLPPERLMHVKEDFRGDIYALGALLFEMLCGCPPFHSGTAEEIAKRRLHHPAPSVLTFAPEVSDATAFIVKRMLEKDRKARFQNYHELIDRLDDAHEALKQRTGGRKEARVVVKVGMQRKSAPWMALIAAGFFVFLAVVGILVVRNSRTRNALSESSAVSPTSTSAAAIQTGPKTQGGNAQLPPVGTGPDSAAEIQAMAPGVFRFVNVTNNWSLHVASAGLETTSQVTTWHNGKMPNSHWIVRPVSGGYQLIAFHSYKALEATGAPGDEKSGIRQANVNGSPAQTWRIEPAEFGACRLISATTGKALAIGDPKAISVWVVGQTASPGNTMEQWRVEFVRPVPVELTMVPTGAPQINTPPAFAAEKTTEPMGGRFVPINIVSNRDSRDPKAFEGFNTNPILRIARSGWIQVNGVPFQIIDVARSPAGKDQMILKGPRDLSREYPSRVELPLMNARLTKLHFLGGVAGWGHIPDSNPTSGRFGAIVVNVTVERMGGAQESFQLRNGLEIIDWVAQNDVPLSTRVEGISTDGFFRYFAKDLTNSGAVTKIILESDGNCAAPVFLAITGESGK